MHRAAADERLRLQLDQALMSLVRRQMPPAPARCCSASNQQLLRLPGLRWGSCTGAGAGHRKGKRTVADACWAAAVTSGCSLCISLLCCWCASFTQFSARGSRRLLLLGLRNGMPSAPAHLLGPCGSLHLQVPATKSHKGAAE